MYCFDTDVLSTTIKRDPPLDLVRRLATLAPEEQFTTAITAGELYYGAEKVQRPDLLERIREAVLAAVRVLPFDQEASKVYGTLRAELERSGNSLHEADLRIASIALATDLTLVTGNIRHFERVPNLRVENWLK